MNVLVVGGGGREHALAWKLASEPSVGCLLCAPGNPGTASTARNVDVAATDLAVRAAMEDKQFGNAGARIVLEECLDGPEVSFFAICDGARANALISAQDHKRAFDADEGPNTGGMGAFAPTPLVDQAMQ